MLHTDRASSALRSARGRVARQRWEAAQWQARPPGACCPPRPHLLHTNSLPARPVPRRGVHDRVIPIRTQVQGSTATPGSWLVSVPDAGHVVPYQHPRQWALQVLRFLDTAKEVGALHSLHCLPATLAVLAVRLSVYYNAVQQHKHCSRVSAHGARPPPPPAWQRCTRDRRFIARCRRPDGRS